jgi:hypothetical protein
VSGAWQCGQVTWKHYTNPESLNPESLVLIVDP